MTANKGAALSAQRERVVVCGLRFSPNVGDGVISECLAYAISRARPDLDITHLDISGRKDRAHGQIHKRRQTWIRLLRHLPRFVRERLVSLYVQRQIRNSKSYWTAVIENARAIVIGGGQLLTDIDGNFPAKIEAICEMAAFSEVPIAFASCGVGSSWSTKATQTFTRALTSNQVRYISARDSGSQMALNERIPLLPGAAEVNLFPDPALLAAESYNLPQRESIRKILRVGVGVVSPDNLAYSGEGGAGQIGAKTYLDLANVLESAGYEVVFFTNGAYEDDHVLRDWDLAAAAPCLPRPTQPCDLVMQIDSLDAVVAPRLHASIVALALGRPSVGVAWDQKVESFFHMTGRPEWVVTPDTEPHDVLATLELAIAESNHAPSLEPLRSLISEQTGEMLHRLGL